MSKEIKKSDLAKQLGISRPTLDKYLEEGFPTKITDTFSKHEDAEYRKIVLENEIRLLEYKLNKLKIELNELNG